MNFKSQLDEVEVFSKVAQAAKNLRLETYVV
ncbi:MAG: hypothetical protein ACI8YP_002925, partial [Algoriphagus sp.]